MHNRRSAPLPFFLALLLSLNVDSISGKTWHRSMTFVVDPGVEDCYYMPNVTAGQSIDLEYQVINSGSQTGNLDITFRLYNPLNAIIHLEELSNDGVYNEDALLSGDYAACFENKFSTFSAKTVYTEMTVDDSATESEDDDYVYEDDDYIPEDQMQEMKKSDQEAEEKDELFHMTVKEIKAKLHSIRDHVHKIKSEQDSVHLNHSRDLHQANNLRSRIGFWSLVQITMVVLTGVLQIVVVKGLFEEPQSNIRKILFWL